VKKILFFIIALFYFSTCFSQQVVDRKNKLTAFVTERYHTIIEANKEVKQGLYQALYNKTAIASGMYTNDKRIGVWLFYNKKGELLEKYEYDTNTLLYEAVEDTSSNMRYFVDAKINAADHVTKPIKIGGRYYAYIPYLRLFKLPPDLSNNTHDGYLATLELLVSPGGRLADYKIHLKINGDDEIMHPNTDLLKEEDKQFIPASLNNEPVSCRIFIQCYVNYYDEIDTW